LDRREGRPRGDRLRDQHGADRGVEEKRAAIETGQEVDRQDINLRDNLAAQAAVMQKAFTLDELEAIESTSL
jgi:hypothetical protein